MTVRERRTGYWFSSILRLNKTARTQPKMANYVIRGLVHNKEQVTTGGQNVRGGRGESEGGGGCQQCDVTPLQNKSVVCSGSRFTSSTVMRLQEYDDRDRIELELIQSPLA